MKVLMHMCCAPCAIEPISILKDEKISFEGFFYNPNIHPIDEYERRRDTLKELEKKSKIKVNYINAFLQDTWESFEGETKDRCNMCYYMRLREAALFARDNSFDAFTTTLLISPYQNHDMIVDMAKRCESLTGVEFFYRDFRKVFRQGQNKAREMGLYRQKYCGCIKSIR